VIPFVAEMKEVIMAEWVRLRQAHPDPAFLILVAKGLNRTTFQSWTNLIF
jgi:hypothetical protein